MKKVVFLLSLALFVVSCGNGEASQNETPAVDSACANPDSCSVAPATDSATSTAADTTCQK